MKKRTPKKCVWEFRDGWYIPACLNDQCTSVLRKFCSDCGKKVKVRNTGND